MSSNTSTPQSSHSSYASSATLVNINTSDTLVESPASVQNGKHPCPLSDTEDGRYRKKNKPQEPWRDWGRGYARLIDAFTHPERVIAVATRAQMPTATEEYKNENQHLIRAYKLLREHYPDLGELVLTSNGPSSLRAITQEMKIAQDGARYTDTNHLKESIIDMLIYQYPEEAKDLPRSDKRARGFNHPLTGRLLCPASMEWSDKNVRDELRDNPAAATVGDWPAFLYGDGLFEPENQTEGLLRGEILLYVCKYIFTGPSTWRPQPHGKRTQGFRKSNARIAGMHKVTARSLAYVATQTRFALSSTETHNENDKFDLVIFFNQIVEYLEDPDFQEEAEELLEWWNKQIFPNIESPQSRHRPKVDTLAKMKAQKAARRQALATLSLNGGA